MVNLALLKPVIEEVKSYEDLQNKFVELSVYPTAKLWIDGFIIPTFLVHLFIRSAKERNWPLALICIEKMIPYFFAASHWDYARYLSMILLKIEQFPSSIEHELLKGSFVSQRNPGVLKAVWNMFGEQTYLRYGKGKGGLVGRILSDKQVLKWTYCYHTCSEIVSLTDSMHASDTVNDYDLIKDIHKEKGEGRESVDERDRESIKEGIKEGMHPFLSTNKDLFNIFNGKLSPVEVNVSECHALWKEMMNNFLKSLPEGFHNPLHNSVKTLALIKKHVKVVDKEIYGIESISSRLLIIGKNRDIDISDLFNYELGPVPPALFNEYGEMRTGNKSVFARKLEVTKTTGCGNSAVDVSIVDGNGILYHINWP